MQMIQVQPPPTEQRSIVKEDLKVSEIVLNDGSAITLMPSIKDVKKIVGQKGPFGEPVYMMQLTWTVQTKVAPKSTAASKKSSSKKGL
jgi:hypothetical protein